MDRRPVRGGARAGIGRRVAVDHHADGALHAGGVGAHRLEAGAIPHQRLVEHVTLGELGQSQHVVPVLGGVERLVVGPHLLGEAALDEEPLPSRRQHVRPEQDRQQRAFRRAADVPDHPELVVDVDPAGTGPAQRPVAQRGELSGESIGRGQVVVVDPGDVGSGRRLEAGVARAREAAGHVVAQHPHTVARRVALQQLRGGVARTLVDDDDLVAQTVVEGHESTEQAVEQRGAVARRHDHRHVRPRRPLALLVVGRHPRLLTHVPKTVSVRGGRTARRRR